MQGDDLRKTGYKCKKRSDRDGERLVGKRKWRRIQREKDEVDQNRNGGRRIVFEDEMVCKKQDTSGQLTAEAIAGLITYQRSRRMRVMVGSREECTRSLIYYLVERVGTASVILV